ncbi:hypothetical protein C0989_009989 [Termitomyces sp. Mn162]|nr:hypothetical protein C0989_009989 [Termitomyces sp. Mn162]
MLTRTLTLSAIASLAAAQVSLSSSCQAALTTIATSPDVNACLVLTPLIPILTNPSESIVDPVNSWLTGLCAAPACSNTTLATIVSSITSGCSAEVQSLGLSSSDNSTVTTLVQRFYPTVRKAVCLKDGNTNCVTETLTNAQSVLGTLSLNNIMTLASSDVETPLPTNITCSNCAKAIYNTVNTGAPGILSPESLQDTCGSSFTDGTTPTGISESASDNVQSGNNTSNQSGNGAAQLSFGALSGVSVISVLALLV